MSPEWPSTGSGLAAAVWKQMTPRLTSGLTVKSSRTVCHTLTAFPAFLPPCGRLVVGQHHKKKGEYRPVVYRETDLPVTQTPPPAATHLRRGVHLLPAAPGG